MQTAHPALCPAAPADQISFGSVTAEDVNDEADVFLLIAPQNIVGHSILPFLQGAGWMATCLGEHSCLA